MALGFIVFMDNPTRGGVDVFTEMVPSEGGDIPLAGAQELCSSVFNALECFIKEEEA